MTKKEAFVQLINNEIFSDPDEYAKAYADTWDDICYYWNFFKNEDIQEKPLFSDNGKKVMLMIRAEYPERDTWTAKEIGERMLLSSHAVSGTMRKLVLDGYVSKESTDPTYYSLTEKGKDVKIVD